MRRDSDAHAPGTPPVRVALVGCGAVARTYYAPALTRLLAGGRVEAVRLFDPSPARAKDVAGCCRRGRAELGRRAEGRTSSRSSPRRRSHTPSRCGRSSCTASTSCARSPSPSTAPRRRTSPTSPASAACLRGRHGAALLALRLPARTAPLAGAPARLVWHEGGPFRWPVASPAYFAPEAGNSLLWDVGSHVLDLLIWWLGAPEAFMCRDDAMGGTATNCVLELAWANGCSGEVRLSREYDLAGGLVVERPSGVLACRDVAEADVLRASDEAVAPDFQQGIPGSSAPAGRTFLDCFDLQLRNVLAAVRGAALLWVPAQDVIDSVGALARRRPELCCSSRRGWAGASSKERGRSAAGAREDARC